MQRYSLKFNGGDAGMFPTDDGEWVKYSKYSEVCQGKETVSGDPTTWGHEAIIDGQRQQIEGLEAEKQGMERRLVSIHEDYQTELKTAEAERNTLQRECDELKQVVAEQDLFESACAAAQRERDTLQQQINQLLKAGQCETVEELINTIENLLLEASY